MPTAAAAAATPSPVSHAARPRAGCDADRGGLTAPGLGAAPRRGGLPNIQGGFTALRYLDASDNKLSGPIPPFLSDAGVVRLVPPPLSPLLPPPPRCQWIAALSRSGRWQQGCSGQGAALLGQQRKE